MRTKMFTIGLVVGILCTLCLGLSGTAPLDDPFRRKRTTENELYHLRRQLKKFTSVSTKNTGLELRVKILENKMKILSEVPVIKRHIKKDAYRKSRISKKMGTRRKNTYVKKPRQTPYRNSRIERVNIRRTGKRAKHSTTRGDYDGVRYSPDRKSNYTRVKGTGVRGIKTRMKHGKPRGQ